MYTVTQRANSFTQPYGGFIPVSSFTKSPREDNFGLNKYENVHGRFIGLAVDYLTRYNLTGKACASFDIPMRGALLLLDETNDMETYYEADELFESARQGNTASAIKLTAFDDAYRTGTHNIERLSPDGATVANVEVMVKRSVLFLQYCGREIYPGLDFKGGYTKTVSNGDCDYLTENALIDLKVLRGEITPKYTLQILMYYIMGLHSVHREKFQRIKWLVFFNPRSNMAYYCKIADIPQEVIERVEKEVIGYGALILPQTNAISPSLIRRFCGGWNSW